MESRWCSSTSMGRSTSATSWSKEPWISSQDWRSRASGGSSSPTTRVVLSPSTSRSYREWESQRHRMTFCSPHTTCSRGSARTASRRPIWSGQPECGRCLRTRVSQPILRIRSTSYWVTIPRSPTRSSARLPFISTEVSRWSQATRTRSVLHLMAVCQTRGLTWSSSKRPRGSARSMCAESRTQG